MKHNPRCQNITCHEICETTGPDKSKPSVKHYKPGSDTQISTVSWPSLWSDRCYYHNRLQASSLFDAEIKAKRSRLRNEYDQR